MIIPRTKFVDSFPDGSNAKNNLSRVAIRRGLKYGAAIYAQEVAEYNSRVIPATIAGALAALAVVGIALLAEFIILIGLAPAAFIMARGFTDKWVTSRRQFELWGKAVEHAAAVRMGANSQAYLLGEAQSLLRYDVHRNDPIERIVEGIRAKGAKADAWLDKHWVEIQRAYEKGNL